MMMIDFRIHEKRVENIRAERDYWRRVAIAAIVVAIVSVILMLIVSGNALESQSVVAR